MMNLSDLPAEILQIILSEAVLQRKFHRALRLRLVNRRFYCEVEQAIFSSRLPDQCLSRRDCNQPFWQSYLAYRVIKEKNERSRLTKIRRTAEAICQETGTSDERIVRRHVETLCRLASHHIDLDTFRGGDEEPYSETAYQEHLLAAAACTDCVPLAKRLVAEGHNPYQLSSLFGYPVEAAALQGNNEIVEIFLSANTTSRLSLRCAAIRGAAAGGHLETLDLALQPRWGPLDLERNFVTKSLMTCLHSKSLSVFARAADLLGTHLPSFPEKHVASLLEVAASRGHFEVARHLLGLGAPLKGSGSQIVSDPLASASRMGHRDIVKLLLERGADPNLELGDSALTCAVRYGQLGIARMLLDHGARIHDSMLVRAVELEHTGLYSLLVERGASLAARDYYYPHSVGSRALVEATLMGSESMVRVLLEAAVEVTLDALFCAKRYKHDEIYRLLEAHKREDPRHSFEEVEPTHKVMPKHRWQPKVLISAIMSSVIRKERRASP